jgi:hypothetical protein
MRIPACLVSLALASTTVLLAAACAEVSSPPPQTAASSPPPAPVTTVVVDAGAAATSAPPVAPTPVAVADAGAPVALTSADAGASSAPGPALASGDFYSCAADADCVAVPKVGCCHNGHLVAVNKQATDAYKASFTCGQKRPMCPQYIIKDSRVAKCDGTSHKCEMVAPTP